MGKFLQDVQMIGAKEARTKTNQAILDKREKVIAYLMCVIKDVIEVGQSDASVAAESLNTKADQQYVMNIFDNLGYSCKFEYETDDKKRRFVVQW